MIRSPYTTSALIDAAANIVNTHETLWLNPPPSKLSDSHNNAEGLRHLTQLTWLLGFGAHASTCSSISSPIGIFGLIVRSEALTGRVS